MYCLGRAGGRLFRCVCIVKAWSLSGSVSVRAISSFSIIGMSIPVSSGYSCLLSVFLGHGSFSFAASCESSCEWALSTLPLWAGRGFTHHSPVIWHRDIHELWVWVCTGQLCSQCRRGWVLLHWYTLTSTYWGWNPPQGSIAPNNILVA